MTIREEGYAEGYRDGYSKRDEEIVRCKDCKYYWENAHECTYLNQGCIKPDFFCGYGEPKDGDGDAE